LGSATGEEGDHQAEGGSDEAEAGTTLVHRAFRSLVHNTYLGQEVARSGEGTP
jgi:hypothetical protein